MAAIAQRIATKLPDGYLVEGVIEETGRVLLSALFREEGPILHAVWMHVGNWDLQERALRALETENSQLVQGLAREYQHRRELRRGTA